MNKCKHSLFPGLFRIQLVIDYSPEKTKNKTEEEKRIEHVNEDRK